MFWTLSLFCEGSGERKEGRGRERRGEREGERGGGGGGGVREG